MAGFGSQGLSTRHHAIDAVYHASSAWERLLLMLGFWMHCLDVKSRFGHFQVLGGTTHETQGDRYRRSLHNISEIEAVGRTDNSPHVEPFSSSEDSRLLRMDF
jgi:hypothetical protein